MDADCLSKAASRAAARMPIDGAIQEIHVRVAGWCGRTLPCAAWM